LFVILKQNNNRIKENIIVIEKIKIRGFTVSHKSPDNCILLKDDRILLIKTLFYYVHDVKISGLVLKKGMKLVYQYPLKSSLFQIWQIKKITDKIVIAPINTIKNKLIF